MTEILDNISKFHELPYITYNYGNCYAKILADNIQRGTGVRITTFALMYPRYIHSQLMTHRVFSRNASSSRAIPVKKMVEAVRKSPACPPVFRRHKKGMVPGDINDDLINYRGREMSPQELWALSAEMAIDIAEAYAKANYSKEMANRILEPYSYMQTILTTTDIDNFLWLRCADDAQHEIADLAAAMKESMEDNKPGLDDYHVPLLTPEEHTHLNKAMSIGYNSTPPAVVDMMLLSAARCARVSYNNHGKAGREIDEYEDRVLACFLLDNSHLSPFEHQAVSCSSSLLETIESDLDYLFRTYPAVTGVNKDGRVLSGNFRNWLQFRQAIREEDVKESDYDLMLINVGERLRRK